ncbi:MAG: hypothetical protein P8078_07805 [bacterium]
MTIVNMEQRKSFIDFEDNVNQNKSILFSDNEEYKTYKESLQSEDMFIFKVEAIIKE